MLKSSAASQLSKPGLSGSSPGQKSGAESIKTCSVCEAAAGYPSGQRRAAQPRAQLGPDRAELDLAQNPGRLSAAAVSRVKSPYPVCLDATNTVCVTHHENNTEQERQRHGPHWLILE
jgi:hypothetical protein